MLTDDNTSTVALPEVPLLAVLPGTGGLTRITDKRKLRRDLADVFCTLEEGIKAKKAKAWNLIDEAVPNARFDEVVKQRAKEFAKRSVRPSSAKGITLSTIERTIDDNGSLTYSAVEVALDRQAGQAIITISGPDGPAPDDMDEFARQGAGAWLLKLARELDDAILHLRFNETETGVLVFKTAGDPELVLKHEALLLENRDHWLANEVLLLWKRLFKRIDVTSRSLVALIEHGSCFAGVLAELLFAVDRSCMMDGEFEGDNRHLATVTLSAANFGLFPMSNGLTRLQTRFLGDREQLARVEACTGEMLDAANMADLGLVTFAYDDLDWDDEVRIMLEERTSFSPDAMTGMEANLRFAGPETMETRIFGRLTAWQNWIFQRPNAVGPEGALQRYGSGIRGKYNRQRV